VEALWKRQTAAECSSYTRTTPRRTSISSGGSRAALAALLLTPGGISGRNPAPSAVSDATHSVRLDLSASAGRGRVDPWTLLRSLGARLPKDRRRHRADDLHLHRRAGSRSDEALKLLGSWAATVESGRATEAAASSATRSRPEPVRSVQSSSLRPGTSGCSFAWNAGVRARRLGVGGGPARRAKRQRPRNDRRSPRRSRSRSGPRR